MRGGPLLSDDRLDRGFDLVHLGEDHLRLGQRDNMVAAMPMPARPALRGWRMIDERPPVDTWSQVAADIRRLFGLPDERAIADGAWRAIYKHGTLVPDDMVV